MPLAGVSLCQGVTPRATAQAGCAMMTDPDLQPGGPTP
jgi:hypothetical protein